MIPDAECIKIVAEILQSLELGDFVMKVSAVLQSFIIMYIHLYYDYYIVMVFFNDNIIQC